MLLRRVFSEWKCNLQWVNIDFKRNAAALNTGNYTTVVQLKVVFFTLGEDRGCVFYILLKYQVARCNWVFCSVECISNKVTSRKFGTLYIYSFKRVVSGVKVTFKDLKWEAVNLFLSLRPQIFIINSLLKLKKIF